MYEKPFYIEARKSSNAFSFERRKNPRIYVPKMVDGGVENVETGEEVVFEDFDDSGVLQSCRGLKNFVRIAGDGRTVYVFDNHNHAFSFWHLEYIRGNIAKGAHVIHVDAHRDTRIPESNLSAEYSADESKIFEYANSVLNVGNFIPPAIATGLVKDVTFICSARNIEEFDIKKIDTGNLILDIDLDFFAPELDYIDNQKKLDLIKEAGPRAKVITFATSPFFIDQPLAIDWFKKIMALI